jgi:anti-sigma regulatory factor (Ser/Thr protein kinase)
VTEEYELCVGIETKNLTAIGDFVGAVAKKLKLSNEVTFALQMAVDEACANVMEHAYAGQKDGTVSIRCQTVGDQVVVTIQDRGRPFDPQAVPRPDPSAPLEKRGNGALGLYLMERLMDSVEFEFDDESGNTLTMKKRFHHGEQAVQSTP